MSQEVIIGARGWLHPLWDERFYPEDMPEEWRLDYYSNEYKVVLVPAAQWRAADEQVAEWRDEVFEDFRFYFEIDAAWPEGGARLAEHIAHLGDLCAGVVIAPGAATSFQERDWDALKELATARFAILGAEETDIRDLMRRHGVVCGAHLAPGTEPLPPVQASEEEVVHGIGGVNGDTTPRQLRGLLETALMQSGQTRRVILFFSDDPPPMDEMDEMITLAEMMGI